MLPRRRKQAKPLLVHNGKMMKKTSIALVVAAGAIIALSFALSGYDIENYPPKAGPIVAFGDSLVEGAGAASGNDFVSVLSRRIGEPIRNFGQGGDTTAAALSRLESVRAQKPRIAIVLLGGNDYLRKVPRKTTFENLSKIVKALHDDGAVVLLLGVRGGLLGDSYASDFESFAETHKMAYVPNVLEGLLGDARYMSDAIHPNDAGYAMIADKVEPVLRKLLR